MQILTRLQIGDVPFDEIRRSFDTYLQKLVEAINHNAKEIEINRIIQGPSNQTYLIMIPHVGRQLVSINAILVSGTCDIVISDGTTDVVWDTAASATLSLSSTLTSDTKDTGGAIAAGSVIQVTVSNNAAAAGLVLTLRTGS